MFFLIKKWEIIFSTDLKVGIKAKEFFEMLELIEVVIEYRKLISY